MKNKAALIDLLPELAEDPWGRKIPAFAEWRIRCKNIYPEGDNYAGFVYGKDTSRGILYFSPYSLGDENLSPNTPFPAIEMSRIVSIEVRRVHR